MHVWVISSKNTHWLKLYVCMLSLFGCVQLLATLWTVVCQALLSMGILQARILVWVAISFSRGSSWPRDWTVVSCIGRQILYHWATREAHDGRYKGELDTEFVFKNGVVRDRSKVRSLNVEWLNEKNFDSNSGCRNAICEGQDSIFNVYAAGHWGCFHILVNINRATMNIGVHVSF